MNIRWLIIVIRVRCGHPRNRARHGHGVEVTVVQAFRALKISIFVLLACLHVKRHEEAHVSEKAFELQHMPNIGPNRPDEVAIPLRCLPRNQLIHVDKGYRMNNSCVDLYSVENGSFKISKKSSTVRLSIIEG